MIRRPPRPTLFPSTTLSRPPPAACWSARTRCHPGLAGGKLHVQLDRWQLVHHGNARLLLRNRRGADLGLTAERRLHHLHRPHRKSTRLNSSHLVISYAVLSL